MSGAFASTSTRSSKRKSDLVQETFQNTRATLAHHTRAPPPLGARSILAPLPPWSGVKPKRSRMPMGIGYHDVKDTDHWLASPKREEFFGPLGVSNIRTFVDPTNRTRVAVLMDVTDMDAVMAAMETPGARE